MFQKNQLLPIVQKILTIQNYQRIQQHQIVLKNH
jgi:hypothetical protein